MTAGACVAHDNQQDAYAIEKNYMQQIDPESLPIMAWTQRVLWLSLLLCYLTCQSVYASCNKHSLRRRNAFQGWRNSAENMCRTSPMDTALPSTISHWQLRD